jgi:hypothetical protein
MPTRIRPNPKRELTAKALPDYLSMYLAEKKICDELEKKLAGMKATMMAFLDAHGTENINGHKVIVVDGVGTITRQRSVSRALDEDAAEEWLTEHGKRDEVIHEVTIEEFNEDDFYRVLFEEKVPQDVADGFTVAHEKYSFIARSQ